MERETGTLCRVCARTIIAEDGCICTMGCAAYCNAVQTQKENEAEENRLLEWLLEKKGLNMKDIRERALKALGLEYEGDDDNGVDWVSDDDGVMREMPNEAELIGMLLLELDRLTGGDNLLYGCGWFVPATNKFEIVLRDNVTDVYAGTTRLEALVLAVEAAREGK